MTTQLVLLYPIVASKYEQHSWQNHVAVVRTLERIGPRDVSIVITWVTHSCAVDRIEVKKWNHWQSEVGPLAHRQVCQM